MRLKGSRPPEQGFLRACATRRGSVKPTRAVALCAPAGPCAAWPVGGHAAFSAHVARAAIHPRAGVVAAAARVCRYLVGVQGTPPVRGPVMLVANHISWLDIPVMHAARHCCFISNPDAGLALDWHAGHRWRHRCTSNAPRAATPCAWCAPCKKPCSETKCWRCSGGAPRAMAEPCCSSMPASCRKPPWRPMRRWCPWGCGSSDKATGATSFAPSYR